MDADIARAATTVIVTTEELVTEEEIAAAARPHRHPRLRRGRAGAGAVRRLSRTRCWGRYEADFDHFAEYTADIDARGVTAAVGDYLARYVHAPATLRGLPRPLRRRAPQARPGCGARTGARRQRRQLSDHRHGLRAAGRDGLAPAQGRHDGLRGSRCAAAGRRARPAAARAEADDGHRGRHHRPADPARAAAGLHQRDARRPPGHRCCRASPTRSSSPSAASSTTASWAAPRSTSTATSTPACVGSDYWKPKVRLPGTGGANDIASLCREVFILTRAREAAVRPARGLRHEPGLAGRRRRAPARAGLLFGGVSRVVTTLGIFGFDPDSKRHADRGPAPRRDRRAGSRRAPASRSLTAPRRRRHRAAGRRRARDAARPRPRAPLPGLDDDHARALRPRHQELRRPHRDARHRRAATATPRAPRRWASSRCGRGITSSSASSRRSRSSTPSAR